MIQNEERETCLSDGLANGQPTDLNGHNYGNVGFRYNLLLFFYAKFALIFLHVLQRSKPVNKYLFGQLFHRLHRQILAKKSPQQMFSFSLTH